MVCIACVVYTSELIHILACAAYDTRHSAHNNKPTYIRLPHANADILRRKFSPENKTSINRMQNYAAKEKRYEQHILLWGMNAERLHVWLTWLAKFEREYRFFRLRCRYAVLFRHGTGV